MSDQQTNLLLVEEVEKHPILYNFHLPGYSKKHETEKAWEEIGNVVKLTAAECKKRWKHIRTVFLRHMKPSLSGSGAKEKKAYYLKDALQFTVPYIKALGMPLGNQSQPPLEEARGLVVGNAWHNDDDLLSETQLLSPSSVPPPNSSSCSSTSPSQSNKRTANYDDVDKTFFGYLDRKQAPSLVKRELQLTTDPREEALKMFLLSMLPDLLKMDDREVRQFKKKTLDVVDEILSNKSS